MANLEKTLTSVEPFDLMQMVRGHGWVQVAPYRWASDTGQLTHTLTLTSGTTADWSVRQTGPATFVLTVSSLEPLSLADTDELTAAARWALRLDEPLAEFHAACREHAPLHDCAESLRGRLLRSPTLWEDVAKTLCTTCTTWPRTLAMARSLCDLYGLRGPSGVAAFPTPGAIAALEEPALRKASGMGYRAGFLHQLAGMVAAGEMDVERWKRAEESTEELRAEVLRLPGIGPYSASNLQMLLGRYDRIAVDSWVRKVVGKGWFGGRTPTDREIHAAFERFGPWRALVYWFWDWDSAGDEWTWRESI